MEFITLKTYDEIFSAFSDLKDAFFHFDGDLKAYSEKIYKNGVCIAAKSESVAALIAFYANDKITRTAYITSLLVDEQCRGLGLASALIKKAELLSTEKGLSRIKLEVRKDNSPAISLYLKHGYQTISESTDSLYMSKNLEVKK